MKTLVSPPKVILMTSHASKELAIEAINIGVYKFIEKPFRISSLLEVIGDKVKSEDIIKLDPHGLKALLNDKKVSLTEIEFKIMTMLLQNEGKLIKKNRAT